MIDASQEKEQNIPPTTSLTAISPVDGRYAAVTMPLAGTVSEFGLFKARVKVEINWLITLAECPGVNAPTLTPQATKYLLQISDEFCEEDAKRIKEIERTTNHDVKAVELYIRERLRAPEAEAHSNFFSQLVEFVHFGCTSEDVNNLSYALVLRDAIQDVLRPKMVALVRLISRNAIEHSQVPLLSRTHGQAASPTTFGKEMANFASRLSTHLTKSIDAVNFMGKFNGAVGNFNAHYVAFPEVDWPALSRNLIEKRLGLSYQPYSTQIECHDFIAELCDALCRFNSTLIDFNVDMWLYTSRDMLKLKVVEEEVGSSTMPHKVNPIDFENSEGNLGIANALLKFFSSKLPISRLQRDLTDSTVLRNLGVALAHCLIAYHSAIKGISKITVNTDAMSLELEDHWEVLAEPIQTVLRKTSGAEDPYSTLKAMTRGRKMTKEDIAALLPTLGLEDADCKKLTELTPGTYTGLASKLATDIAAQIEEIDGSV